MLHKHVIGRNEAIQHTAMSQETASYLAGLYLKTVYADKAGQKQVKNLTYNTINEFFFYFGIEDKS
jgi:hypothetical protein